MCTPLRKYNIKVVLITASKQQPSLGVFLFSITGKEKLAEVWKGDNLFVLQHFRVLLPVL